MQPTTRPTTHPTGGGGLLGAPWESFPDSSREQKSKVILWWKRDSIVKDFWVDSLRYSRYSKSGLVLWWHSLRRQRFFATQLVKIKWPTLFREWICKRKIWTQKIHDQEMLVIWTNVSWTVRSDVHVCFPTTEYKESLPRESASYYMYDWNDNR